MRALKLLIVFLLALAAYKAVQVLVLGKPLDPRKALAEWATAARSERPEGFAPGVTLTKVDFRWQESNSIWFGEALKDWTETYELQGTPGEQTDAAREQIVMHVCRSGLRQKVFGLGMPVTARILGPGKYDHKELSLTKAGCAAKLTGP